MDFEILEEYDEDYDRASIRVTSPLQSDIGADFELFLGDCFRDPLLSFLGIERFSWDSSHWLKAAVWLSAEIAAWRHLDRDKGLYAKMVAKTESYRDRDATLAEFNALKRSAADPNISLRKRLQLLERAALIAAHGLPIDPSGVLDQNLLTERASDFCHPGEVVRFKQMTFRKADATIKNWREGVTSVHREYAEDMTSLLASPKLDQLLENTDRKPCATGLRTAEPSGFNA